MDEEHIVESGYDRMAEQYLGAKDADDPITLAALEQVARDVPQGGAALDLGCGAGVPVTQWLAQRFVVTGVDVSAQTDATRPWARAWSHADQGVHDCGGLPA